MEMAEGNAAAVGAAPAGKLQGTGLASLRRQVEERLEQVELLKTEMRQELKRLQR